jgi:ceramide glucosyltransferase
MRFIAILAEICAIISIAYYIAAAFAARRFAGIMSAPTPAMPASPPRCALLKPLRGLSANLFANIESYLELDYPNAEFYFGVSSRDDRAAEIPELLRDKYGARPIKLVVGEETGCENRKVAKLIRMAEQAAGADAYIISDADVAVEPDHLRRVVAELFSAERVGVVSCLYRAHPSATFASRLEALTVNTDFAPLVMVSAAIEPMRYALGATIAIKRKALDDIGGLRALKDLLADDFYIGKFAADRGWDVRLSSSLVTTHAAEENFRDYWNHQLRWARTYRTTRPLSLTTIVLHGPFWALLAVAATGGAVFTLKLLLAVLAARLLTAAFIAARVLGVREQRRDLWLVPFKDLCMTGVWFASLLSNRVLWAGRRLEILHDGTMREVHG